MAQQNETEDTVMELHGFNEDDAVFNYEKVLRREIDEVVTGKDGDGRALHEIFNNSFDGKATEIYTKIGRYFDRDGKLLSHEGLLILDNGLGLNRKGMASIASYGKSSRDEFDTKTIGLNGTGSKFLLALGDYQETNVTVLTYSDDYPRGVKFSFNFSYLLELMRKGKINMKELVKPIGNKGEFNQGWSRERGTTIILTGFDVERINQNVLFKILQSIVSPRSAQSIKCWNVEREKFLPVWTPKFTGKHYAQTFTLDRLGEVTVDLYQDASAQYRGPMICGTINPIMNFDKFVSDIPNKLTKTMGSGWGSFGGYIYIERLNVYRRHTGSLAREFYKNGSCEELMHLLGLVSQEFANDSEGESHRKTERNKKLMNRNFELLRAIAVVGEKLEPEKKPEFLVEAESKEEPGKKTKPRKVTSGELGNVQTPVFITPAVHRMRVREEDSIMVENRGTSQVDLSGVIYKSNDTQIVNVVGNGQFVELRAGNKAGNATVTVTGDFGEHKILVTVLERDMSDYISGPKTITAGTEANYELVDLFDSGIKWEVADAHDLLKVIPNPQDPSKVALRAEPGVPMHEITLYCMNGQNKPLGQKKIKVLDGGYESPLIVTVGTYSYKIVPDLSIPCPVQVESLDIDDLPRLYVNLLHPAVVDGGKEHIYEVFLYSIAIAATSYQVEKGVLKASEACMVASDYIEKKKQYTAEVYKNITTK